ncbi:MAG: glycosyltransferase family 4 protein [Alphaproteobacteria bacterium]|nr:glycosyltransferase family 4 protein [Alphaproteobacteria bacterium]
MKILHILRAPIGGLFRHVKDLAEQQANEGHQVGLITATPTDNDYVKQLFADIEPIFSLGIDHLTINRLPGLSDYQNIGTIKNIVTAKSFDVIHGHGAKGGAYARLVKRQLGDGSKIKVFYTMHGGTLHYNPSSPVGFVFLKLEKYLQQYTDGFVFESENSRRLFEQKVDKLKKPFQTIPNGLSKDEFYKIKPVADAADFLYIGELRMLKGVDLLINAFAKLCKAHKGLKLIIIGYGPEEELFKSMVAKAGIYDHVTFLPPTPAAEAFKLAKVQVMPSRAEGLPYMTLETIAAQMPLIASDVGGIPEIYGEYSDLLFHSEDEAQLFTYMQNTLDGKSEHISKVVDLQKFVKQNFNVEKMARNIINFYTH